MLVYSTCGVISWMLVLMSASRYHNEQDFSKTIASADLRLNNHYLLDDDEFADSSLSDPKQSGVESPTYVCVCQCIQSAVCSVPRILSPLLFDPSRAIYPRHCG